MKRDKDHIVTAEEVRTFFSSLIESERKLMG
ncbi:unnamed protein product [Protopolystoma xenopodis]|uniref:Uncharacterized protein n=1 Tax=Protopolystoma xenopodis TaxID=117903 RepID=A0A448WRK6_9PLAT|nr:unnamed protein product [Protopolystoma xenopodis]